MDDPQIETQMAIQEEKNPRVYKIVKEISSPKKYITDLSYVDDGKICLSLESDNCRSRYYSDTVHENIPDHDYFVHGMAGCKCGSLLVSVWNGKLQEKSKGKILKFELFLTEFTKLFEFENDKHRPLFTFPTHITENGNADICVSDAGAVVVIDERGVLRFRYYGLAKDSHFDPYGICADSECNIIVADMKNDKIHMIDQNGGFICFVYYENMKMPRALCIDENDNLYVSEWKNDRVKVISSQ
ncbi:uncharacterized protein LOC133176058 [Saccostrea echinata]|uniref:uncharacterized protein LOC133176058 n=1 Tax=Saccostrea echinata TaxID=191078 RepID=UPI002A7FF776|nr:uncharacterized protein LOC133176058 [Saccostrea echinata]